MKQSELLLGEPFRTVLGDFQDNLIWVPENNYVDKRLRGHVDLSVFYDYSGCLFVAEYLKDFDFGINTETIQNPMDPTYPMDASLNIFCNKQIAVLNTKTASPVIQRHLKNNKIIIDVKQGYSNCCLLGVTDDSFITSDYGVYHALINTGYEVLKISPGNINLPGYDYGFIGGSGFSIDENTIAFTGTLDYHPDKNAIISFIERQNKKIQYLTQFPLFDIGSAIRIEL